MTSYSVFDASPSLPKGYISLDVILLVVFACSTTAGPKTITATTRHTHCIMIPAAPKPLPLLPDLPAVTTPAIEKINPSKGDNNNPAIHTRYNSWIITHNKSHAGGESVKMNPARHNLLSSLFCSGFPKCSSDHLFINLFCCLESGNSSISASSQISTVSSGRAFAPDSRTYTRGPFSNFDSGAAFRRAPLHLIPYPASSSLSLNCWKAAKYLSCVDTISCSLSEHQIIKAPVDISSPD